MINIVVFDGSVMN